MGLFLIKFKFEGTIPSPEMIVEKTQNVCGGVCSVEMFKGRITIGIEELNDFITIYWEQSNSYIEIHVDCDKQSYIEGVVSQIMKEQNGKLITDNEFKPWAKEKWKGVKWWEQTLFQYNKPRFLVSIPIANIHLWRTKK